ncbi:MAG: diguanylate cyclase [Gammaproteobacteria bacterium]|nr:diguanylate cyclase [Gammaproteobacteria bacterium]
MIGVTNTPLGTACVGSISLEKHLYRMLAALGVALLYVASAKLGLLLAVVHGNVTAVWPPTGIALAALLLLGTRMWPAIAAAALLVNLMSGLLPLAALLIAAGNTLAGLVGARLVCQFAGVCNPLDSCKGLLVLVAGGALAATSLSATVGVTALVASGLAPVDGSIELWLTWWLGDASGVLVFAPLLLAWGSKSALTWNRLRFAEGLAFAMMLFIAAQIVFSGWFPTGAGNHPLAFLMLPLLIWAALRFGRRGTSLVIVIVTLHAVWGTVQGYGPFVHHDLNESLLMLQAYMSISSLTALMLASEFHERKLVQQRLVQHQSEIERRIADRTQDLVDANRQLLREMHRRAQDQDMVNSLGQILEESRNEIYIFDADTLEFINVNQGARINLGYTLSELAGITPVDIKPEMTREMFDRQLAPLRDGSLDRLYYETVHCRKDGSVYPVEVHLQLASLGPRRVFVAMVLDISERRESDVKLRQAATVFDNSNEGVMVTDANRNITAVNRAFTEITGHDGADLLGKKTDVLRSDRHDQAFFEDIHAALHERGRWQGEIWHRRENGEAHPHWTSISEVFNEAGSVTNYVYLFTDIAAIEDIQKRVKYLAYHDPLTHLPNRTLFDDRLAHALHNTRRSGKRVAVLFLDLDGFKDINDGLGHLAGDELLQQVAGRLVTSVRDTDTVTRYGGDEFTIILEGVEALENVVSISERILYEINKPFIIGGHERRISTSIGVSVYPEDGRDKHALIERADVAMYLAKRAGGNRFSFCLDTPSPIAGRGRAGDTDTSPCKERP